MLNPYYVTGLLNGEGIFTYTTMGGNIYPYFGFKADVVDMQLLEKVRKFFGGVGAIYKTGSNAMLKVFRMEELMKLVWHFGDYPLEGKKAEAFKIWKEMVMVKTVNRKEDWPKLHDLAAILAKANGGKRKHPRKRRGL